MRRFESKKPISYLNSAKQTEKKPEALCNPWIPNNPQLSLYIEMSNLEKITTRKWAAGATWSTRKRGRWLGLV